MNFKWRPIDKVSREQIDAFDCGNYDFNVFLKEKAEDWQAKGECVTHVCCLDADDDKRIYGYASINTLGLLYNIGKENKYLNCIEIRTFAIAKQLRKNGDVTTTWSEQIFKSFLQELYYWSMSIVGFDAIFLYSNEQGFQLYKNCGFSEVDGYELPSDNKMDVNGCVPLMLIMDDSAIDEMYV